MPYTALLLLLVLVFNPILLLLVLMFFPIDVTVWAAEATVPPSLCAYCMYGRALSITVRGTPTQIIPPH